MEMSRKRERELRRLKRQSAELWEEQKEVLDHASKVALEAGRQARYLGREEVAPRMRTAYESGRATARQMGQTVGAKARDFMPGVTGSIGAMMATLEASKDPRVQKAIAKARASAMRANSVDKQSSGPGRYILIAVGVVAVAGIAYAAWQTLRADDEMWVADEVEDESLDDL
jgi:hypothetical protein